jgi:hypothetical protein
MKHDKGSTLPLVIGLASLLLATVFLTTELQTLLVQRSRALNEARFAALYVAKQSAGFAPVVGLDYSPSIAGQLLGVSSVRVSTQDGKTFEAIVCETWKSPFGLHAETDVCDSARARVIS